MKLKTKVLLFAGVVLGAIAIDRKRRPQREMSAGGTTMGTAPDEMVIIEAEIIGISEVDPEGLAGMGEGVDLEALEDAHGKKMY